MHEVSTPPFPRLCHEGTKGQNAHISGQTDVFGETGIIDTVVERRLMMERE